MEHFVTTGLKCDNTSCDWVDSTIPMDDWQQWLNKPCPKCGCNLLTEEDYQNALILKMASEMIGSLTPEQIKAIDALELSDIENKEVQGIFENTIGLEKLKSGDVVNIKFDTHKGIKAVEVKSVKN